MASIFPVQSGVAYAPVLTRPAVPVRPVDFSRQILFIDNHDGFGQRDYTPYLSVIGSFTHERNRPALITFTLSPVGDLTGWAMPVRGARVQLYDGTRWLARVPSVTDHVVFTGYISDPPKPVPLGKDILQDTYHDFIINCTSEDYLVSALKMVPAKNYVNKTHGEIIIDLLKTIFIEADVLPYSTREIYHGGLERLYQTDPGKKFIDIIGEFAKADGFTYYVLDGVFHYHQEVEFLPNSNDPEQKLMIDDQDPRYTADGVSIAPVSSTIINDVTVLGLPEATNLVREHFVSDGYQGFMQLAFEPFGTIDRLLINDDFTDAQVNTQTWTESDTVADFIQEFQGSLNIIGGAGTSASTDSAVFLRAHKGLELAGIITTRDGELTLGGTSNGVGIIGGMYTSAGASMPETDLFCGWKIFLDTTFGDFRLYPFSPDGLETAYQSINKSHNYVLRRTFEIDRQARPLSTYTSAATDVTLSFPADPQAVADCWITWQLDEIVDDDPAKVYTVTTTVLRKQYHDITDFVTFCPVVSYNLHAVMNFVAVKKPQQIVVLVDGSPVTVGNALDGGRCTVTVDNAGARLAWYATPKAANGVRVGVNGPDTVTIPVQGSLVEVQYWQQAPSSARVQDLDSIGSERTLFRDDGIRQQIIRSGDLKPTPSTSEECQALALAYIADRVQPRYEGSYKFVTNETDSTNLMYWPMPGDLIPVCLTLPDRTLITQRLSVTKVEATLVGRGAYQFALTFGPINRVDAAIRALVRKRASTLDEPSLADLVIDTTRAISTKITPTDPGIVITGTTPTTFSITAASSADVTGYEVRTDDTGWGQPNYILQFTGPTYTFTRTRRDERYYIRPFNAGGVYSRRSAFVRIQHPLPNVLSFTSVVGTITPDMITVDVTMPLDPDYAGIEMRVTDGSGDILYKGDGITSFAQTDGVNVLVGTTLISVRIPNVGALLTYTIWVTPYDLLRTTGTPTTLVI